jgi:hypothetical protein
MLKSRYIVFFLVALFAGCKKDNNDSATKGGLEGRWKMTAVMDKGIGLLQAPAGSDGQVYLEFKGSSFSGKTMKNSITNGLLQVSKRDSITFGTYTSTLVAENQWGGALMTMLSACMLQSLAPCRPSVVTWKSDRQIEINTPLRYLFTLEKF